MRKNKKKVVVHEALPLKLLLNPPKRIEPQEGDFQLAF